jgi:hypothetical protein
MKNNKTYKFLTAAGVKIEKFGANKSIKIFPVGQIKI